MTHYDCLGVSPGATRSQLRAAYRERMRAAHPDVGGNGDSDAMRALSEAWSVLGSPTRRAEYDRRRLRARPTPRRRTRPVSTLRPLPVLTRRPRLARLTLAVLGVVFGLNVAVLVLTVSR